MPRSAEPRLVIDIGGGSTELIIGRGLQAERLESLTIGCVGMTQRFFPDGAITASAMQAAETEARVEIEAIARGFGPGHWHEAYASSGTAMALADIKRFVNAASLPADSALTDEMDAFTQAAARPAMRSIVDQAFEQGFQQRSDVELNVGTWVGKAAQ